MASGAGTLGKSEMVYRSIRARIIAGEYATGRRLVLGRIARDLEVSQVPVREALRRLEAERLVTFTRNVGAEVASVVDPYAELVEALAHLEGAATSLAAPHLSDDQLDHAQGINDELGALAADGIEVRRFIELNEQFHTTLWAACPNRYLVDMVRRETERVQVIRINELAFAPANAPVSVGEHARILGLIRDGAPVADVEAAARAHKMRGRRMFVAADVGHG